MVNAAATVVNLGVNAAQARSWVPTIKRGTSVVYAVLLWAGGFSEDDVRTMAVTNSRFVAAAG